ncbi:Lactonase, 7-bladed beta-propeller-domain-containing protein, partial [Diaporthe sp. PMI_573]
LMASAMAASAAVAHTASPAILYAASYSGGITSLKLETDDSGYTLNKISDAPQCGSNPVWLEHDKKNNLMYCSDEAGTLGIFKVAALNSPTPGVLEALTEMTTSYAPVASTRFNIGKERGIAFAHYGSPNGGPPGPAGITSYVAGDNGSMRLVLNLTVKYPGIGPNEARQGASHIHQVILDPTGKFIVAPNLGSDCVHVYSTHNPSFPLTGLADVNLEPGSGPRHGVFQTAGDNTFFHLVSELANNITTFNVTYDGHSMSMTQIGQVSTFGDKPVPSGALAGEIILSPGGYITVSNRLDNSFVIPNLDPKVADPEPSDSLAVFKVDNNGKLSLVNLYPVGCQSPRQIQTNKDGSLLAAACMLNNRVVVMQRNSSTGEIGQFVANYTLPG